jgi:glutathione S-transferase
VQDYKLIIGNRNYSSWSLRAWLVMKRVNAAFDEIVIPLYQPSSKPAILEYSPSGKVPALIHGAVSVWDSLSIAEYLHEQFPEAKLWPADPAARAYARSISAEMHSGFRELRGALPMNIRAVSPGRPVTAAVQEDIDRILAIWRDARGKFGAGGDMLFGEFSIADAMFAPVVMRFMSYAVSLDQVATDYVSALVALPDMAEWIAAAKNEPWIIPEWE